MLTHIVIWKYRADVADDVRDEHRKQLRGLTGIVPGLENLSVGADILELPRSFHTGLVIIFQNRAALDAYTVHPEHVKVVDFGREISEHVASVDFED